MVSQFPNPLLVQELDKDSTSYNNLMDWNVGSCLEDPNRKIRKPYTITKSRESWSEVEHDKFLEALQLFDRDWKKIEAFVGSKTVIQIRSHAQKYFLKVQKSGTSEHVPPPRPKRKAAHPYPQKAPKSVLFQGVGPLQSSVATIESVNHDSIVPQNQLKTAPLSHWAYNLAPTSSVSRISKDDLESAGVSMMNNYSSSSNENTPCLWNSDEANPQVKEKDRKGTRDMPDFAEVYRFIGSIFDPSTGDHLQKLKRMDPVNIETVVMLMKNLSVNLVSPEFENHRKLLSSHNITTENDSTISAM